MFYISFKTKTNIYLQIEKTKQVKNICKVTNTQETYFWFEKRTLKFVYVILHAIICPIQKLCAATFQVSSDK